ncbi:MAG: MarR family transcriptional regulator [Candidatus Acidiferrales bacterium]|jgi:MarR family 2-MHQ and catechol resistance regulon transcriptional repressor
MEFNGDERAERAVRAHTNLVRAAESAMALPDRQLDSLGPTTSQFRALETLLRLGPMTRWTLAKRVLRSGSNMTAVLDRLKRHGLVVRRADENGRRKMVVHLTPEGKNLLARVLPLQAKLIRAQMAALGDREQEALARLCGKLGDGNPVKFVRELTAWTENVDVVGSAHFAFAVTLASVIQDKRENLKSRSLTPIRKQRGWVRDDNAGAVACRAAGAGVLGLRVRIAKSLTPKKPG